MVKDFASNIGYGETFGVHYTEHPTTHVIFKGYVIPEVPKMIQVAKAMHRRTPQVGIISWDLSIDEKGRIILIEANYIDQSSQFPQIINGMPMFGDDTPYMLSLIKKK